MNYSVFKRASQNIGKISIWILLIVIILSNLFWAFRDIALRDFGSFIASGNAAHLHHNPYQADDKNVFNIDLPKIGLHVKAVNLNPPILLPFFELLSTIDIEISFRMWQIVSISVYLFCLWLLIKTNRESTNSLLILWMLGLAGFWHTIELGQIYIPLVALSIGIWIMIKNRHLVFAGILLGILIAIKPNFIFWAIFLIFSGYFRVFITAIFSFSILWILPIFRYGPVIYFQWFSAMQEFNGYALPANNSFIGLTSRFGSNLIGTVTGIALILIMFTLIIWRRPGWQLTSGLAIVVSLLTSPTAWSGYTLFLLPLFYTRKWTALWKIIAAFFVVPFPLVFSLTQFNTVFFIIFGWFYGWAVLILLGVLIWDVYCDGQVSITTSSFSNTLS